MTTVREENGYRITTYPSGAETKQLIDTGEPPVKPKPLTQLEQIQNDLNFIILKQKGLI